MARIGRHVLVDVSPPRRSRDLRCLAAGQLLSTLGAQLTMVAVAYQVYALTHSSLAVGLVSLAQVLPLIADPPGGPRPTRPTAAGCRWARSR